MKNPECDFCQGVVGVCITCDGCFGEHCQCDPCQHGKARADECVFCERFFKVICTTSIYLEGLAGAGHPDA